MDSVSGSVSVKKGIAGVDEAGRGPLAGPVYAAAVILNPAHNIADLNDSKLLTEKKREQLFVEITETCISYGIAFATVDEIDEINILQASLLAMRRAVSQLTIVPTEIWVDGNQDPKCPFQTKLIVQGDKLIPAISAASIIAKVTRDHVMQKLDREYPGYGFAQHKGYGTKQHLEALQRLGATPIHRRSFAPVREVCMSETN
ncbi:MAG: ribonuclease HII [Gammaproteobacteria bacterium RIFCSPHIGHO2_12_FULL_36_30]|nr:MAG: ribonuclease HII [Gammaproteobacteria bacterium RIFCSPHIGHO2_12_FULL_36_30]